MSVRWTHFTVPVTDLNGTIAFFEDVCGLSVVRDRRQEGGSTVWIGPEPKAGADPDFVVVIAEGEIEAPLDHFGFQCTTREEVDEIGARARRAGTLVAGPEDMGGSVGYFVLVREPSGHLVEFTHGQPIRGLGGSSRGEVL
jgi:catechol 2,3-dioxygenase-like lactoylglutathione lyase family enzyme